MLKELSGPDAVVYQKPTASAGVFEVWQHPGPAIDMTRPKYYHAFEFRNAAWAIYNMSLPGSGRGIPHSQTVTEPKGRPIEGLYEFPEIAFPSGQQI